LFWAVYLLPAVLSSVLVRSILGVVLRFDGSLNVALKTLGLSPMDWLGNGWTALGSLVTVYLWSTFGISVLIVMAGLSTVSQAMLEAARLDGAKSRKRLRFIVIPTLRPIIEFVAVVGTTDLLTGRFGLIFVLTAGGPGTATTLSESLIWLEQGKLNRPGYAAISAVLFVLMAGVA